MTLIELVITMAIVAILAAIAIPRYTSARDRAYVAVMQADLNQLRRSQELYYRSPQPAYADDLAELDDFRSSPEVTITLEDRGDRAWGARASHDGTDWTCSYESDPASLWCQSPDGEEVGEEDPAEDPPDDDPPAEDPGDQGEEGAGGGWFWK